MNLHDKGDYDELLYTSYDISNNARANLSGDSDQQNVYSSYNCNCLHRTDMRWSQVP